MRAAPEALGVDAAAKVFFRNLILGDFAIGADIGHFAAAIAKGAQWSVRRSGRDNAGIVPSRAPRRREGMQSSSPRV